MPIPNYSVLQGLPTAGKVVTGSSTHYQISIEATGGPFTVAVNIESTDGSEVLYAILDDFVPPDPAALLALESGMHALASQPGGLALDFVREQIGGKPMITQSQMALLPISKEKKGSHATPLENAVDTLLNQAVAEKGTIFAFGSSYADNGEVDGIHDIHMNQGNPLKSFGKDNGVWQDGAVFIYMPSTQSWTAIFIAFQTESWDTDDDGNPVN
ncbi:DUF2278 family protein [Granulicella sp. WH15]|uniref:YukJ family protein n=1 Tax=Granulicella sp. WH15 TaxID=2602070 RepID=UPI00136732B8|nr:YukJ family protein [Granulicella sp. WH15]QHN03294.1 DUF2278 family protein [Granulicella sp. WH15]